MSDEKEIKPIFIDIKKDDGTWDSAKADTLRSCGYEIVFIPDADKAVVGMPNVVAPVILPSDAITRCLYKAVKTSKTSMDAFSRFYLEEIGRLIK